MSEKETQKLYSSITNISDDIIENAQVVSVNGQKKKKSLIKWGAVAACFCILAVAVLTCLPLSRFVEDSAIPPNETSELANNKKEFILANRTSESYSSLPELLSYLSTNDFHDAGKADASGGRNISTVSEKSGENENLELIENEGVAIHYSMEYSYHIGESGIQISQLNGVNTKNVDTLDVAANAIFTCNNNLFVISQFQSGGSELDPELSVRVSIYDITVPQRPVLKDEYVQLGELTACWMVGADLYLITSDGVCACGWSRLDDVSKYYPALAHNGGTVAWGDEEISILGEPTRVQYSAITVINGNTFEVEGKKALYGNILKLFYGTDWIAVSVSGNTDEYRENPSIYTFDRGLGFTGKINAAKIIDVSEINDLTDGRIISGDDLSIVSVTKHNDLYRMIGTYTNYADSKLNKQSFMAIAANVETGKADYTLLDAKDGYPYSSFTEILWEDDRAILCVGIMNQAFTADMTQESRFLFVDFDSLGITFHETDLRAAYLDGRVGVTYGSPMGNFSTLIPMGKGIYLRYSYPAEGPGGFDLYDFSDSAAAKLIHHTESSLSGTDAFDYVWYVYDQNTIGTLKVILGEDDYFRNVKLAWCKYSVNPNSEEVFSLISETQLEGNIKTFFGADAIGFAVFDIKDNLYYIARYMDSAVVIQ